MRSFTISEFISRRQMYLKYLRYNFYCNIKQQFDNNLITVIDVDFIGGQN